MHAVRRCPYNEPYPPKFRDKLLHNKSYGHLAAADVAHHVTSESVQNELDR